MDHTLLSYINQLYPFIEIQLLTLGVFNKDEPFRLVLSISILLSI
jgi:hypothetical protein